MNSASFSSDPNTLCHIVAIPYPGRGHINPMMNLCKFIASKSNDILISFVVTEEWLGFIGSDPKPDTIRFCSIPNVLPSELVRGNNLSGFMEAVWTKMDAPFECLLDQLEPPATLIMADTILLWAVSAGNRRNIPVVSFWPLSAMTFSVNHHFHLLRENGHFPIPMDLLEKGDEQVDYIPGVSSTRLLDILPANFKEDSNSFFLKHMLDSFSWVRKAKYLLLASIYEIETKTVDTLKAEFPFPVYTIGPAIPLKLGNNSVSSLGDSELDYLQWLDRQPRNSVLYVSLGSFLSVSSAQMDEIAAGLNDSGVRFLWVVRNETSRMKEACSDQGFVVPWCDQLRLLMHPSTGGFWSHCGWNSVQEAIFAGIPFLTFPLAADQMMNTKLVVEDWKIGWRLKKQFPEENLVARGEISWFVEKFMDLKSAEVKEMRERAKELQEKCQHAIDRNGSSDTSITSFISNISHISGH
ncbi:UDP-glycosyltransferase 87A1-like [Durio zibethinus]|uniref:UDP-glycosyltransferase 87A1-like n=1 Tax=Durio zibethinus TaxID=66656 RepID=A0A6P5XSJ9_DURZI|nr:UDP-glycosyltransferase 87A1-like [Durio zibethinus]